MPGIGGRDIAEDVREKFVEKPCTEQPRFYRFNVEYYERSLPTSPGTKVGGGEVLILTRRHPDKGKWLSDACTMFISTFQ